VKLDEERKVEEIQMQNLEGQNEFMEQIREEHKE
jgi:hypothetical protein